MTGTRDVSWFRPFFNLDKDDRECLTPHGLIERGMPYRVVLTIHDLRGQLTPRWDLWNCGEMADAWAKQLRMRHPRVSIECQGDPPGTDHPTSGYYVDGCGIRTHVWVIVGPRQLIFDPTAYQFDEGSIVALP